MAFIQSLLMAAYIGLVAYGAWSDARELRIPNWVSLALLALFFPMALVSGMALDALALHLGVGLAMLVFGFVLFALGLFGGGDAKLLSACALWVGWPQAVWFMVAVILVGGVLSLFVIGLRKGLGFWPDWLVASAKGLFEPNKAVPYGIAIAAGAIAVTPRMDVFPELWREIFILIVG